MKNTLSGLFLFTVFFFHSQLELSRNVIGTSGQSTSGTNMQMSYTIGEPFTATLQNNSIQLPFAVPGGLSPNGDLVNDNWLPIGFENYPEATVKVFDRWGQEVFYATSKMAPWDGTLGGNALPTADYYYIIDLGDGQKFNGVVTLKR